MTTSEQQRVPMDKCTRGRLYKLRSRNLSYGVFDGDTGFIGIREKWGDRCLFTEYHYDTGPPFGSVFGVEDTGIDVPSNVEPVESLGSVDHITDRPVAFDKPIAEGGKGWYFLDTGEASEDIRACRKGNRELFYFLRNVEE